MAGVIGMLGLVAAISLGLGPLVAAICAVLAAGHIGTAVRHGGKGAARQGESEGGADELELGPVYLRDLGRCELRSFTPIAEAASPAHAPGQSARRAWQG